MFQRILVPLDGSTQAEKVLPMATHLARTSGASLFLLQVVRPLLSHVTSSLHFSELTVPEKHGREEQQIKNYDYLSRVVLTEQWDGIRYHLEVQKGEPASCILQCAQKHDIDLIVMGVHGGISIKRWAQENIAQELVRNCPVPVLLLRDTCTSLIMKPQDLQHPPRVLVPLDGSLLAENALLPAAQLSAALASSAPGAIHLTRTVQYQQEGKWNAKEYIEKINQEARTEAERYLKNVEQRFTHGDVAQFHLQVTSSVVTHVNDTEIWKRILEESECIGDVPGYSGCDIITMVTHGRHGLQHLLHNSVTEKVFDAGRHPLLIVHDQHSIREKQVSGKVHEAYQ